MKKSGCKRLYVPEHTLWRSPDAKDPTALNWVLPLEKIPTANGTKLDDTVGKKIRQPRIPCTARLRPACNPNATQQLSPGRYCWTNFRQLRTPCTARLNPPETRPAQRTPESSNSKATKSMQKKVCKKSVQEQSVHEEYAKTRVQKQSVQEQSVQEQSVQNKFAKTKRAKSKCAKQLGRKSVQK